MTEELILKGKIIIYGKMRLITGLHIGGSTADLNIGGVDNSVLKSASGIPYIPGSSLKGKMRSLLAKSQYELTRENFKENKPHSCDKKNCVVCNIFGRDIDDAKKVAQPHRLIVRDSFMDIENFNQLVEKQELKNLDLEYTEVKYENFIDRLTSAANPRQIERVPAGNIFNCEFIFNIYLNEDLKTLQALLTTMKLLEDDYLGGSGTRGSGKIKFDDLSLEFRTIKYYEGDEQSKKYPEKISDLTKIDIKKVEKLISE